MLMVAPTQFSLSRWTLFGFLSGSSNSLLMDPVDLGGRSFRTAFVAISPTPHKRSPCNEAGNVMDTICSFRLAGPSLVQQNFKYMPPIN